MVYCQESKITKFNYNSSFIAILLFWTYFFTKEY